MYVCTKCVVATYCFICRIDKDLVIKVADFGLSRDIYADDYYRMGQKGKIPIKWMPTESIHDRYYDQKTDVVMYICFGAYTLLLFIK